MSFTDRSCSIQDLCIDSNSGHGTAFESYGSDSCKSEDILSHMTGEWACLSTDSFLNESISCNSTLSTCSYEGEYHSLLQQLSCMVPHRFLDIPVDEYIIVKGASKYINHLRQILANDSGQESDSTKTQTGVFVPKSCSEHLCHVQTNSTINILSQCDEWSNQSSVESGCPQVPPVSSSIFEDHRCPLVTSMSNSVFDDNRSATISQASCVYANSVWQNKAPNHQQLTQPELFFQKNPATSDDRDTFSNTSQKPRKNSYRVVNDHTFSDIVPCSENNECVANTTSMGRDRFPWVDYCHRGQNDHFTRIMDPGLRDCLPAEICNIYELNSLEKYPVLSSLLDDEADDAIRKSALPWTHGQSFVSSMKHFDDWDFAERDDDDDVFVSPNQTEPDPTTEKRYNTTGKKYTEKGQTKGLRRPKNGFIRFSVEYRKRLAQQHPKLDNREVSKMLGAKWRRMSHEEKIPYEMEFRKDISELRTKHPEWRYAPLKQMETEHIEPMPSRLRPRDKLKKKFLPTIIKYGPTISEKRQLRGSRRKRGKMAAFSTYNSFAWFQCKLCYRWRYVPCIDDDNLPLYQSMWFCHMNPDPTCNSCFAEDGLSTSHSVMTSSVASGYQPVPCSSVSIFTTAANLPLRANFL